MLWVCKRYKHEVFNIACGKSVTLSSLIRMIKGLLGSDIEPMTERKGDIKHSLADISKVRRILGYEPKVDLKTGIERTIEWMQMQRAKYITP